MNERVQDDRSPSGAVTSQQPERPKPPKDRNKRRDPTILFVGYLVVTLAVLIVLRARVDALNFISVGWMLALAAVPLLPILAPRLGEFLKAVSPYVQGLKVGAVQIDLREVRRETVSVPSTGTLAHVPNDVAALSSGTAITEVMASLGRLRRQGGSPVAVIDLRDGQKWRLPNLYFVARLLELEPIASQLLFTEMRGAIDGYLVGTCRPEDFRRQVERTIPQYADASARLQFPADTNLFDSVQAQQLGTTFQSLLAALPVTAVPPDLLLGYVSSSTIVEIVSGLLSDVAVDARVTTLSEEQLFAVVESPYRYVPATTRGRINGIIDREVVALAVARASMTKRAQH